MASKTKLKLKTPKTIVASESPLPVLVTETKKKDILASVSRVKRKLSNNIFSDKYPQIAASPYPFNVNNNGFEARSAILLSQQAYWTFPLLRNTIEVMTELANSRLLMRGGNKRTNEFVSALMSAVNIWKLKEQFFREFFRSGTVPIYRFDGKMAEEDNRNLKQIFGSASGKIPVRYILLNPADIAVEAEVSFVLPTYKKVLTSYEVARIRNPKTHEDKEIRKSLDAETLRAIDEGSAPEMKLDPNRLSIVFYKKQDYEPLAVPFAFPLLEDIDAKLELKRIDRRVARLTDRALLLITAGAEPEKGGVNGNVLKELQNLFAQESVARTLVADYTVKGQWLIPDLNQVLGQEKYKQLDKDISEGLNAILFSGGEKFANTSIKVQVFTERLEEARAAFLNGFLMPEIKRVCKDIGAKNYPEFYFEEINLKDELQYAKFYASLAQLGLLTPDETFEAVDSGKLPSKEQSIENQREYKKLREEGLFAPIGGKATEGSGSNTSSLSSGRPPGGGSPQTTKTITPVGKTTKASFSINKIKNTLIAAEAAKQKAVNLLKKKNKLDDGQAEKLSETLMESIIANEPIDSWEKVVAAYISSPVAVSTEVDEEIEDICLATDVSRYMGAILRLSKVDNE